MSEKRKDNKGRLLRPGELQRSDGQYEYRYIDSGGVQRSVYSWRLVETDKIPDRKRATQPLREIEQKIRRDCEDGIAGFSASHKTLNQLFEDYIETKFELKDSTRTNYKYMYKKYVEDSLGKKNIDSIKYSDVKKYFLHLIKDLGFKPNSVETVYTLLHPVFEIAVKDDLIRTNPSAGIMADIKRSHDWEKKKRHALTEQQQGAFIDFIRDHKTYGHWLPIFTLLLGTGCRIGEAVGLRWEDCDFYEDTISINHSLIYRPQESDGKCCFRIETPKTKAGTRIIPMLSDVKRILENERVRQMKDGFNQTVVDGYCGFIFSNKDGGVISPHNVNRAIERIALAYNKEETKRAESENREANLLPHFTAHHLRHTFCTRFCENETNLKVIQEIMGHADITTTMDIYNEATTEKKKQSFANLDGKIKIS